MALISLKDVSVKFGGPRVLDSVSLNIESGERGCLTGRNGGGKSTLLKVLSGEIEPNKGKIIRQPNLRVAILSQDVPADMPGTAAEIVGAATMRPEAGEHHPGAERFLTELGVKGSAIFNTLSGGMRRRVLLARALSVEPRLLLLDEPTNHLDIPTIEWLENHLRRGHFATLFVTHDRSFLQKVANKVLDLDRGQLSGWNCDYRTFLERKQELLNDEAVLWERKSKLLAKEEAWLRKGVKARRTRNEGRVASLQALRKQFSQRRVESGVSKMDINVGDQSGRQVVKLENISYAWPDSPPLIRNFSARVIRGERVGIIGRNGAGKTTLINLLCGKLKPNSGNIVMGAGIKLVFLDQLRGTLDKDKNIIENIAENRDEIEINGTRKHVYGYLEEFLFSADRARTKVNALSGGEKARLLLAKLFTRPGNLLVMDEPTNDLDVETLEMLEEQLANYKGTLLLASHDRTFLDNVVTSTLVMEGDGGVEIYPGGYSDWLQQRPATVKTPVKQKASPPKKTTSKTHKRLSFKEKSERGRLPREIERLEKEISELQTTLANLTIYQNNPQEADIAAKRLPEAEFELERLFERWTVIEERAIEAGERDT